MPKHAKTLLTLVKKKTAYSCVHNPLYTLKRDTLLQTMQRWNIYFLLYKYPPHHPICHRTTHSDARCALKTFRVVWCNAARVLLYARPPRKSW